MDDHAMALNEKYAVQGEVEKERVFVGDQGGVEVCSYI
jgi:hypothetical protein